MCVLRFNPPEVPAMTRWSESPCIGIPGFGTSARETDLAFALTFKAQASSRKYLVPRARSSRMITRTVTFPMPSFLEEMSPSSLCPSVHLQLIKGSGRVYSVWLSGGQQGQNRPLFQFFCDEKHL